MTGRPADAADARPWHDRLHIGGWVSGSAGSAPVIEAATGEPLGSLALAAPDDVDRAVPVVAQAQRAWQRIPVAKRNPRMLALAAAIDRHRDRIAAWLVREAGATKAKAHREIDGAIAEIRYATELSTVPSSRAIGSRDAAREQTLVRMPIGVVGVITPFNAPFILAMRALAPSLALGNGAILKPDPRTAVSGGLLLPQLIDEAGIPAGLVSVLPGDGAVGARISAHPGIGSALFTGSTAAGRRVGAAAGAALKRIGLELGGNNAVLVLDDADIEAAARRAVVSSFLHQGQICMSAGRYLVQEAVYAPFVERLAALAEALTVGDPWRQDVDLGPLIDEAAAARLGSLLERSVTKGAVVRCGGTIDGLFMAATVLGDVHPDAPAYREEIFGPIAPVTVVRDDEHAVELATDTDYGLVAAIHSADEARARTLAESLPCGTVRINDVTNHDEPRTPMSGWGASGNGSAFGGPEIVELLTRPKLVSVLRPSPS